MRPWDEEERAWAAECVAAGDTAEDIAEMAGRTVEDVEVALAELPVLSAWQRKAAALYVAGATLRDIGRELKPTAKHPQATAWSVINCIKAKGFVLPARRVGRSPDQEARRYA